MSHIDDALMDEDTIKILVIEFLKELTFLKKCCWEGADLSSTVQVLHWKRSVPDGEAGGAIVKLLNGKYGAMMESQDYTGHG